MVGAVAPAGAGTGAPPSAGAGAGACASAGGGTDAGVGAIAPAGAAAAGAAAAPAAGAALAAPGATVEAPGAGMAPPLMLGMPAPAGRKEWQEACCDGRSAWLATPNTLTCLLLRSPTTRPLTSLTWRIGRALGHRNGCVAGQGCSQCGVHGHGRLRLQDDLGLVEHLQGS